MNKIENLKMLNFDDFFLHRNCYSLCPFLFICICLPFFIFCKNLTTKKIRVILKFILKSNALIYYISFYLSFLSVIASNVLRITIFCIFLDLSSAYLTMVAVSSMYLLKFGDCHYLTDFLCIILNVYHIK